MNSVLVALGIMVSAFAGFLAGYMKKKGENLAIHEDIQKVVDQVKAVTEATKTIENRLSGELWDRQKHWEMKKEALFEITRRISELDDALLSLYTVFQQEAKSIAEGSNDSWAESKYNSTLKWSNGQKAYDQANSVAAVVCTNETTKIFDTFGAMAGTTASKMSTGDLEVYKTSQTDLYKAILFARKAIRKELGVHDDSMPQSSGSFEVPAPAVPAAPAK